MKKIVLLSIMVYGVFFFYGKKTKFSKQVTMSPTFQKRIKNLPLKKKNTLKRKMTEKENPLQKQKLKKLAEKALSHFPSSIKTTVKIVDPKAHPYSQNKIKVVKVLIQHEKNGISSSYNALLNQETGMVVKTFNRPIFDFKKKIGLRYAVPF